MVNLHINYNVLHWFVIEINHKYPTNDLVFNALIEWLILYYMNIYFSFTSQWLTLKQINPLDCHFHIVESLFFMISFTIFQYNLINRLGWNCLTLLCKYKVHEMPFNSHENHFLYINSKKNKNPHSFWRRMHVPIHSSYAHHTGIQY